MIHKYVAAALIFLTLHAFGVVSIQAKTNAERDAERASKAKASVLRFGTGEAALVKVRLTDGRKVEGYISEAGGESFVVTNTATKTSTIITYPQVGKVQRNNLKNSTWITIGVLAAVGVVVAAVLLKRCGNEGGC